MPVAPSGTRLRLQGLPDIPGQAAVWRADELARNVGATRPTGHAALDAVLPGGGWPVGALVEVLQPQAGQGEWRLLLPALGASSAGALVLVNPPHRPFVPALAAQGLDASCLLMLQGPTLARDAAARVWACEQALRGAGVAAVLAWLPQVRPEQLRRLQMAAQNFQQLLFVMRPLAAQQEASPAVLRLALEAGEDVDALSVRLLKRRGPPLTTPLVLPARPERLQALLAASRQQSARRRQGSAAAPATQLPAPVTPLAPVQLQPDEAAASVPASAGLSALINTRVPAGAVHSGGSDALDRLAAPAVR